MSIQGQIRAWIRRGQTQANALALVNFVLDRAWIRSQDCQRFSKAAIDSSAWNDLANPGTRRPDDAQLRRFEDWLRDKGIVGDRGFGIWGDKLPADDQTAIDTINAVPL